MLSALSDPLGSPAGAEEDEEDEEACRLENCRQTSHSFVLGIRLDAYLFPHILSMVLLKVTAWLRFALIPLYMCIYYTHISIHIQFHHVYLETLF